MSVSYLQYQVVEPQTTRSAWYLGELEPIYISD